MPTTSTSAPTPGPTSILSCARGLAALELRYEDGPPKFPARAGRAPSSRRPAFGVEEVRELIAPSSRSMASSCARVAAPPSDIAEASSGAEREPFSNDGQLRYQNPWSLYGAYLARRKISGRIYFATTCDEVRKQATPAEASGVPIKESRRLSCTQLRDGPCVLIRCDAPSCGNLRLPSSNDENHYWTGWNARAERPNQRGSRRASLAAHEDESINRMPRCDTAAGRAVCSLDSRDNPPPPPPRLDPTSTATCLVVQGAIEETSPHRMDSQAIRETTRRPLSAS
jgi:hypothetical protein